MRQDTDMGMLRALLFGERMKLTVEAVGPGHPDKMCDAVSDAVVQAAIKDDPGSRVACEVAGGAHGLLLFGEMTTGADLDLVDIARRTYGRIGYDPRHIGIQLAMNTQSADIAAGTDADAKGAGDQGGMVGWAINLPEYGFMPPMTALAQRLVRRYEKMWRDSTLPWGRPDAKSQVVMNRDGEVTHVTMAVQHNPDIGLDELRAAVHEHVIVPIVGDISPDNCMVNGTGIFVLGGIDADAGLTGRKIVVDAYGRPVPVGGGCYSGKDPTKVDRTAAYMCRHIALAIIHAGLAQMVRVEMDFTIGQHEPDCFEIIAAGQTDDTDLMAWARERFPLSPAGMIKYFGMTTPEDWSYEDTAAYGHYGRGHNDDGDVLFPWEDMSRVSK